MKPGHLSLLVILLLALGACSGPGAADEVATPGETNPTASPVSVTTLPSVTPGPAQDGDVRLAYTYQQADGNRVAPGRGSLPDVEPLDIALDGEPRWLVSAPLGEGSLWIAVLADGQVQAFAVTGREAKPVSISPDRLPPEMPPLLAVNGDSAWLIVSPDADASTLTHPAPLDPSAGALAYITRGGDVAIPHQGEITRLPIGALIDDRIAQDDRGRLLLLADPTTRYGHGILGDESDAGSVALIETGDMPQVAARITVPAPGVIEGIMPLWADLSGDGERDIIVTVSDAAQGSRIVVYDEEGNPVASGPAIGQGFRWRHPLAVAPFGPGGEVELAVVRTPHVGGIVEFYRLAGDRLEIVATLPGYSTHCIGSRNLDTALAADLDGDDRVELLVPDQAHTTLAAIRRTVDGAEAAWTLPIGGQSSTNIAAVPFADGRLAVGIGHDGDRLRLWLPD